MTHRARSRLFLAATFLALGAAITIAIAWCAVAWGSLVMLEGQDVRPPDISPGGPLSEAPVYLAWPWPVPADWPKLKTRNLSRAFALQWDEGTDNAGLDWNARTHIVDGLRAGWPWKSMRWVRWEILENQVSTWTSGSDGPLCPASMGKLTGFGTLSGWVPRRLPLTPIWPAFIGDTLLYAAASAAMVLGPIAAFRAGRRARRRRMSHCTACGYPVQSLICPECGAPTSSPAHNPGSVSPS